MRLEDLKQRLGQDLAALEQEGRYAHPAVLSGQQGPRITIQSRSYCFTPEELSDLFKQFVMSFCLSDAPGETRALVVKSSDLFLW